MKTLSKNDSTISRRHVLPLLGSSLMMPFFGIASPHIKNSPVENEITYETLLRSDGSIVKVKKNTVEKAQVIKKNLTNPSLLKWLGRKLK